MKITPVDFAILGGGGAGLSMLCHLHWHGLLKDKQVVIVDPEVKTAHDRTWSFWEKGTGPFESVVCHEWTSIGVHNDERSDQYQLSPFGYKMIISSDFYRFCNELIDRLPNVQRLLTKATDINELPSGKIVFNAASQTYHANFAFSSLPKPVDYREIKQPYLDQHFRGWFIRTEKHCFDPGHATLMDFRTNQHRETRFFYVLPISETEALVEIAIFSNDHLNQRQYDQLIGDYLTKHWPQTGKYEIYHSEQGVIPMTTYPYPHVQGRLIHLGMGGGFARPSTGYTFYNIQQRCADIARQLKKSGNVQNQKAWPSRHLVYDATLLSILSRSSIPGAELFPNLFGSNPTARVLDFLNGETTIIEELKLMSTTNITVFGKSFLREVVK